MRKLLSTLSVILVLVVTVFTPVYSASVPPQTFPGNDSNPKDFTPPEGCIHYEIPDSGDVGTHTVKFNALGEVDPEGPFSFTVVVGQEQGENFTKVLSWTSNFPIRGVIVKGGPNFNLYEYGLTVRGDTDLVSPTNPSGDPANVSHVSIVICPGDFPIDPTCPTDPTQPTDPTDPTKPTDPTQPCPPLPPNEDCCNVIGIVMIFIMLIVAFFLLGILLGAMFLCPKKIKCKKYIPSKEECKHCKPQDRNKY